MIMNYWSLNTFNTSLNASQAVAMYPWSDLFFFALVASYFVFSDELCLALNHGRFCMHDSDQLVEGQVVVTNLSIELMVPSFITIDGSVKN